jgi:Zn-dependent metalloprotease
LVEDVPVAKPKDGHGDGGGDDRHGVGLLPAPEENFFVDAHSGEVIARLPRAADASAPTVVSALDELNNPRTIRVSPTGPTAANLHDTLLNIHTFDFKFADAAPAIVATPAYCENPPDWLKGAVSAHANAALVSDFLRTVLRRRGVDNRDGALNSNIHCSYRTASPGTAQPWANAMWSKGQMFYGQRRGPSGTDWVCLAIDLDIVAHEITHGLTQASANLEYLFETGALNESYSDIFGVIIANYEVADRAGWEYRIGRNFRGDGTALRNLADPAALGQPAHMDDFQQLLATQDNGGVHANSGIHNKAAHGMMAAIDTDGTPLFSAAELAAIFYLALTQHLSRTSLFSDSRRGVELSAMTLLRHLPPPRFDQRIRAIRAAFDSVGIA